MESADTRERILDAARELFHRHGYAGVGVARICEQARVVKGSFYHFFPTKEELMLAVIDHNWRLQSGKLADLRHAPGTGRERLEGYFRGIVATAREMHRAEGQILGCNLGNIACELAPLPGELQERLRAVMQGWRRVLQGLIEDGQADGSVDPGLDPRAAADAVLALTQGMSVLGRTFDRPAQLSRIADLAMQLLPPP